MADTAALALGAAGAGANLLGSAIGGKGASETPVAQIDPAAVQGLREGVASAQGSLQALPGTDVGGVVQQFTESGERLAGLQAPQPVTDPTATTQQIAETAAIARQPMVEAQRRAATEQAGAFGPGSALNQAVAGQQAQEANLFNQLVAQLQPQLQAQQFSEMVQSLSSALGLEGARQQTALSPVELVENLRGQRINQLLGAGSPAGYVPTAQTTPALASTLQAGGSGLVDAAQIVGALRRNQDSGSGGQSFSPQFTGPLPEGGYRRR